MRSFKQFFLEMRISIIALAVLCVLCGLLPATAKADGAVYAMTNALGNNQILVYHRASDGSLSSTPIQTIATGGGGSGLQLSGVDSLGSAGSVQLDPQHHFLFAVNTESTSANNGAGPYNTDCQQGTITSFLVASDGTLTFVDRVFSRGLFPNSLTVKKRAHGDDTAGYPDLLYVLNAGGPEVGICNAQPSVANEPNITGFKVNKAGYMTPIGSEQPIDPGPASATTGVSCVDSPGYSSLTGAPAADFQCGLNPPSFPRSPAQIRFTPDGNQLVVTVKGTNAIYVFPVDANGSADSPKITQAPGPALPTFLGFTFDKRENLLVAELFGSAATIPAGGAGAVSSFSISGTGNLSTISSHVGDGGTAAGTIALEPVAGKFAYVGNNLSASISSYAVGTNGSVTLLAGAAATMAGPNDLATATDGGSSFLYVVEGGTGTIGAFQINLTTGALTALSAASGLPTPAAQGLAAY